MKNYKTLIAMVAVGLACSAVTSQAAYDYSSIGIPGSGIQFNSDSTFQLNPTTVGTPQFEGLVNNSGATYFGNINGAPWTIGAITINGGTQSADITTPGMLFIGISPSDYLQGTLTWGTIQTIGTGDNINISGQINVTGITVIGSDPVLLGLLGGSTSGTFTLSSTYNNSDTLTQLAGGSESTHPATFSGSFTAAAVPEPSTVVAGALMLLPFGIGAIRSLRKDRSA